ncbi:A/G-specific adenine glycosylase [Pelagibacteraceae bacterium]|nr:A/G-specific adenine glycosylase [Pelagibacteraceae bacterium]
MHLPNNLSKKILAWYDNNKRELPWRVSKKSPKKLYYRLLSEFMLQQTQVKTALPYFKKFLINFPTLESLSKSNEKKVLKLWEGLGYYRRARNLLVTAKTLVKEKNSKLPKKIFDIKKLPGVGDYTANALLAFVYDQPTIAIDGNVKRVFSRILNKDENSIDFPELIKSNKKSLFKIKRYSDFVEALMEFGALICKPKEPECLKCNIRTVCKYFKSDKKFKKNKRIKILEKNYNIFCYIDKIKKKIALTKNHNLGFLNNFYLPQIKEKKNKHKIRNWNFHSSFKESISNKKLNISLYYKYSSRLPFRSQWFSLKVNNEFIPSFTKKIFKQFSNFNS